MFPYERLQYGLNFVMRTKEKKSCDEEEDYYDSFWNKLFILQKNIEGRAEWRKNKKVLLSGIAVKPIKNVHAYKVWNCQFQQPLTQKSCVHSISVEELRFAFHFCRTLLQQRNTLVLRPRSVFLGNQKHDARFQHQIKIIVL